MRIRVAILTVSDRCSRGEAVDTSGPALAARAADQLGAELVASRCVPDEMEQIADALRQLAAMAPPPDLVLTTGGTGLAPRDVTPEATLAVLDRQHAGLMELIRARCGVSTPRAYLSRGIAGAIGRTLVLNLPGSERGAVESLDALADVLPHALGVLSGTAPDHPRTPTRAVKDTM